MEDMVFGRRYRVTEKIGAGGMAEVYKAVDEVLGRTVAVKVMHPRYASDATFAARFRQEAQAAANLQSPNIVNMYDWGQENSTFYMVMEYVRGTDLKSLIAEKGALDSRRVAQIGAQVCAALSVAHGYDVIHRDIKPHNVMVTPDGSVKVMDFGIARAGNTTMTQTGSVLGTAHYVSPEQAQGRPLTAASDLYSLGVTLYEAATGKLPFDADSPVAIALKQVNEQPRRPREINPNIDPGLEAVIMRAMAKKPAERYATAEDMRRDLRAVAEGRNVAAPTAVPPADGTAVMPAVPGSSASREKPAAPVVRPIPKRSRWPWIVAVVLLVVAGLATAYALGAFSGDAPTVPNVVGMQLEAAEASITAAGFVVGPTETRFDPVAPAGQVIEQSPEGGAEAKEGTVVELIVSKGPEMTQVPSVVEMPEEQARQAITAAGLVPEPLPSENSPTVAEGLVVRQEPTPGAEVPKGSSVQYVVSRGRSTVVVPDVRKQTRANAEKALRDAGLTVAPTEAFDENVKAGLVISQNPNPGVKVEEGTTVSIVISKGSAMVDVPDVIGMSREAAVQKLEAAGLKVTTTFEPHAENNVVLDQSPKGPGRAQRGSTVTIVVDAAS